MNKNKISAIILAAGLGIRLRPITDNKPKTLININGKPILGYQIEGLLKNDIKKIIICVGYKSKMIIDFCKSNYPTTDFKFVLNKDYKRTNNMYSLYLARKFLNRETFIMNGDVVFSSKIISGMIQNKKSLIATDINRYIKESMKIKVDDKGYISDISKQISKKEAFGCSVDIYKFQKDELDIIKKELDKIINIEKDLKEWTELLLQRLFKAGKLKIKPYNIKSRKWWEIDDFYDLNEAEKIFNENFKKITKKRVFFIDKDGTLILGNKKIKGADKFINYLKRKDILFRVLSNNSSKTKKEHCSKLKSLGFNIEDDDILLSTDSLINYLIKNKTRNIYLLANKKVTAYFSQMGFIVNPEKPEAIVLTYDTEINYEKLVKATFLIRENLPYFATHLDNLCPTEKGLVPDIGTFIKIFKMSTGRIPDKTFGKPASEMIVPTLKKYNFTYKDCVIIGDRLYTDIKMANDLGMLSVLVLSGETKREKVEFESKKPKIIIQNIGELIDFYK